MIRRQLRKALRLSGRAGALARAAAIALAAAFVSAPLAQEPAMPTSIRERYWLSPGPKQDSPEAPKLLLIYPEERTRLSFGQELTRYAGRVDPPNARVELDGERIQVFPGGVFTGILTIPVGRREVVFTARSDSGAATTIRREIVRAEQSRGPAPWPLAFHPNDPVQPSGAEPFELRAGGRLAVRLHASPGHRAQYRLGEEGEWREMREVEASVEQGGAYTATIEVARDRPALEPQTVGFRLTATAAEGRPARTIELASELTLRRLPDDYVRHGVVRDEFGTLFKSRYGDDRWGNLIAGSAFRIFERWGPRLSIHSVAGQAGFVESASVDLLPEGESPATLELTEPSLRLSGRAAMDRLTIEWSAERPPAALYLGPEVSRPSRLTVEFPSNVALRALSARFPSDDGAVSYIESVALRSGGSSTPPRAVFDLAGRELWGYGLTAPEPGRVELAVRARPDPPSAARDRPLGGLRVIVDAGHGGRDPGSIGPSGIAEADLNLVVSALLGRRLEALGAEVLQTRRDDAFVELDDRVRIAWAWDPDLFISVHHNSVDMATHPTKVRGPQVYYHYPHAIPTARKVAEELSALLAPGAPPDVRPQFFRVNRNVSPCPSILVEVAFICNPLDEAMLRDDAMLGLIAEAIARGVARVWTD